MITKLLGLKQILFGVGKCDIMVKETRFLGYKLSRYALALSPEKKEKLMALEMPVDRKSLLSKLALFAFFSRNQSTAN